MKGHRLFIAISVPPPVQKVLTQKTEEWREPPHSYMSSGGELPIRWIKQDSIHITLIFIGRVGDEELARIASILPLVAEGTEPFEVVLHHIGMGPNQKNPRMVWAEGDETTELVELQKCAADVILEGTEARVYGDGDDEGSAEDASKKKPFRLHVTLGRIMPFQWKKLGSGAPKIEKNLDISFTVNSIELMESEPGPKGPIYTVLSSAELG